MGGGTLWISDSQIRWERGELFDSGCGDEVVFLDADAGAEGFMVEAGFGGEDVAFLEGVIPGRVEVRGFVWV